MVKVYLPLGYPKLSGEVDQTLIYQGDVVRLYQIPKDPRTEGQIRERKIFSDFARMRSTIGLWGRGALRAVLGNKWSSALFQLAKIDHNYSWSNAWNEWDELLENEKEGWRNSAIYQATNNDPGRVFYALSHFIHQVLFDFSGHDWGGEWWSAGGYEEALLWWQKNLDGLMKKGIFDDPYSSINYVGSWSSNSIAWTYLTTLHTAPASEQNNFSFYCKGRFIDLLCAKGPGYGSFSVYLDGVEMEGVAIDQYYSVELWQQSFPLDFLYNGLHFVQVKGNSSGYLNLDAIMIS